MMKPGVQIAHWSAADLAESLATGEPVSVWNDRMNGIPAVTNGQAIFVENGLDKGPAVRFDATGAVEQI